MIGCPLFQRIFYFEKTATTVVFKKFKKFSQFKEAHNSLKINKLHAYTITKTTLYYYKNHTLLLQNTHFTITKYTPYYYKNHTLLLQNTHLHWITQHTLLYYYKNHTSYYYKIHTLYYYKNHTLLLQKPHLAFACIFLLNCSPFYT